MSQEDLELLRALEAGDAAARRRAIWISWSSVLLAAAVLAVLVVLGYRHLGEVQDKVAAATAHVAVLEHQERTLLKREKQLRTNIANLELIAQNYQAIAVKRPVKPRGKIPDSGPALRVEEIPRVYLQIVNSNDEAYAQGVAKRLKEAGFEVPDIETVEKAAGLKNTEVRYYKKADLADGVRLVDALRQAGVKSPAILYLGLEKNTKLRPKTYEVWFAAGVGEQR